jgi:hypothetical protein
MKHSSHSAFATVHPLRFIVTLLALANALHAGLPTDGAMRPTQAKKSITHNGVTWTFAAEHNTGTFCNGEYWVIGPVSIISITNSLNAPGFEVKRGKNGSMINPVPTPEEGRKQGYDSDLGNYDEKLNVALLNGEPISSKNPLTLQPNQTLISMVSWLYRSKSETEAGCPKFNGLTKAPRPITKSAGLLTCLTTPPPPESFRPPYCGNDKTIQFKKSDMKLEVLKNLEPSGDVPDVKAMEGKMSRTWVDHGHEFMGSMIHPSQHMPNYGRDMAHIVGDVSLLLNLDFSRLPGSPTKERLAMNMVQYGIDLAGIADSGGCWPANGGHLMGRKWPILMAGLLLNDAHMKSVGQWKTRFQENEQTFYVNQATVDLTHSGKWDPDKRSPRLPYETEHIGMPEWGIRHFAKPEADNREWATNYRAHNGSVIPTFALAGLIMGQKKAWNQDSFFDYADRFMTLTGGGEKGPNALPDFPKAMWLKYRNTFAKTKWLEPGQKLPLKDGKMSKPVADPE